MTWVPKIEKIEGDPFHVLSDTQYETLLAFHIVASSFCAQQWEKDDVKRRRVALFRIRNGETKNQAFERILDTSMHDLFFQGNLVHDDMRLLMARIQSKGGELPEAISTVFMFDENDGEQQVAIRVKRPDDYADPVHVMNVMLEAYRDTSRISGDLKVKDALELCLQ